MRKYLLLGRGNISSPWSLCNGGDFILWHWQHAAQRAQKRLILAALFCSFALVLIFFYVVPNIKNQHFFGQYYWWFFILEIHNTHSQ